MIAVALVILLVIFGGVVMVVLWRVLSRHATQATVHLQSLSQDYLQKQEELKQRLEESEKTYQQQLSKSQSEADGMKRKALEEAEAIRQKVTAQAREEVEKIMQKAVEAREAMRRDMDQLIDRRAVERAGQLVAELLPEELRASAQGPWVESLLDSGLIDLSAFGAATAVKEAQVVSAFPLTAAQRAKLTERLRAALGPAITIQEKVDPALVVGLSVAAGEVVLDGSLAARLRKAIIDARGTSG